MRSTPRPRRYLGSASFVIARPFFRYDYWRDAHVLRVIGHRSGPVIRRDRRRQRSQFAGSDRRAVA